MHPDRYDPFKGYNEKIGKYDLAFVCVDTPMMEDGSCDLSQVRQAISETDADVIVLKSTVVPTTTDELRKRTGKRVVFSPEYYGTTQHCNNFEFDFTILGGDESDCRFVQQILQNVYDARHRFFIVDSVTAELAKYMENSFLATKVSFCVQFWELANHYGVSYEKLRELFLNDVRVNPSHTFVYDEHPYWESHCLDKDVSAIAKHSGCADFLDAVMEFNKECKSKYKKL